MKNSKSTSLIIGGLAFALLPLLPLFLFVIPISYLSECDLNEAVKTSCTLKGADFTDSLALFSGLLLFVVITAPIGFTVMIIGVTMKFFKNNKWKILQT